jgi:monoterpene epsilon-lactone hydrolase
MAEIDAIRALLGSKPRPVGWSEWRRRLDEVGSVWPVADDVSLQSVDLDGVPGEFSIVPGSDSSRVLMFLHGGGYCSGSILSHRRMVTEAGRAGGVRTLAVGYRLAPEHPFPAAYDDALMAWRWLRKQGIAANRIAVGGDSAGGGLSLALAMRLRDARDQGCNRSAHSPALSRRACERLCAGRHGADRSAHLTVVRGPARTATDAYSGRIGGDAAR